MGEDSTCYLCNPEVVLREEDEEGALLFNPDTNAVKVVNPTGLFIWKQFAIPNNLDAVTAALQQEYEGASADQIKQDAWEFVEGMLSAGFLATVVTPQAD